MQKNYNLTYAAGFWKEDLQVGLCWLVGSFLKDDGESDDGEFLDYLAPTWSWASVRSKRLVYRSTWCRQDHLPEEGLQLLGLEISYLPGALAAFGCITFARLTVCTRLHRTVLVPRSANLDFLVTGDKDVRNVSTVDLFTESYVGSVYLNSLSIYEDVSERYRQCQTVTNCCSAGYDATDKAVCSHQLSVSGFERWCMPCLVWKQNDGSRRMLALVLAPTNADRQEYHRIGLMKVENVDLFPSNSFYNLFVVDGDLHQDFEIIHIV